MMLLRVIAPLLGFLVLGLANLPLSSVLALVPLQSAGVSVGDVSGSVWNGTLSGVTFRDAPIGQIDVATQPLDLVAARPRLAFRSTGVSGYVSRSADGFALTNVNGRLALSEIQPSAPVQGDVILGDVAFSVGSAGCVTASGQVQVDGIETGGVPAAGPYAGAISCEAGDLAVSLAGADGGPGLVTRIDVGGLATPETVSAPATAQP